MEDHQHCLYLVLALVSLLVILLAKRRRSAAAPEHGEKRPRFGEVGWHQDHLVEDGKLRRRPPCRSSTSWGRRPPRSSPP